MTDTEERGGDCRPYLSFFLFCLLSPYFFYHSRATCDFFCFIWCFVPESEAYIQTAFGLKGWSALYVGVDTWYKTHRAIEWYAANFGTQTEQELRTHLGAFFDAAQKHHAACVEARDLYSKMAGEDSTS